MAPPIPSHEVEPYVAQPAVSLTANTVRTYDAPEADQGVAADETFFYPVDNSVIGKYRRDTGELVARFAVPGKGLLRHMNSCLVEEGALLCANSNYSLTPMASSVETFDPETMTHRASHSLGLMDEGSLTWFDRVPEGRIAGFAHYDENGSVGFKNHRYSGVVLFDDHWRRMGGWMFPDSVTERMAPYAASGGAIGPDGYLYVLGHDRPEMYVLGKPVMGPVLIHIATIEVEAEGQAFSFDPADPTQVFVIDRRMGKVRLLQLPPVPDHHSEAVPFRPATLQR
ncbi:hypothetical protein [Parvularcula sp. LCG005]|uniref:hypothetical protein n=1 Tax=Parvularcula sp. LCG005 TaxID=3078805 RepID=UPI002943E6EF|nr:hypothetical protein [Parvularcula sp. LCG005]WOI53936.1 hypothetical protein RUI03_02775 [Parvularcula sp. LCG005]